MPGGVNLATKYSSVIDERFFREAQCMIALNNDYEFTGEKTVKVYSIPIVKMGDYQRSGTSRYGTPDDLARNVQSMTITKDRAFTFLIDKGDKLQSEMVSDAGKALSRQLDEVVVPEFDTYVFKTLAAKAIETGNYASDAITQDNAYSMFLKGMETLGDNNIPDKGRVCFCTYRFANLLKQDPAFMRYGDASQDMILKGIIGECDGCQIVKVPSNHLPAGCAFLITHSIAATAPKQLEDYRIHDDPPGISGWLVEGRFIYDCFVLNEKAKAIYYHGGQQVVKSLNIVTAATAYGQSSTTAGDCTVVVNGELEASTNSYKYAVAATASALPAVTYGTAVSGFTALPDDGVLHLATTSGKTAIRVVEVDASSMPVAVGDAILNVVE